MLLSKGSFFLRNTGAVMSITQVSNLGIRGHLLFKSTRSCDPLETVIAEVVRKRKKAQCGQDLLRG
jgi:hypothetical protein